METTKRKGLFSDISKQLDVMEGNKHRVTQGDCSRWNDLPNELLLQIFEYLPHDDLQQIRVVSKRWNYLAHLPEFLNNSKLVLNSENVPTLRQCLQQDQDIPQHLKTFTTFKLHCLEPSEDLRFILMTLGSQIRKLCLHKSPVFELLSGSNLPQLEELVVTHIPVVQNDFADTTFNLSEFKKLKSLDIGCSNLSTHMRTHLLTNLALDDMVKLEKLCIEMDTEHEYHLINALQCHGASLKHLEINFRSMPVVFTKWRQVMEIMEHLSTLKVLGVPCYFWLKYIFDCLPKNAPLRHLDLSGGLQLGDPLLVFIIQKWAETLENVEIMFCSSVTDESVLFFGVMRNSMRALNISHCSRVTTTALLEGLICKTNYKLNKLVLNDIVDKTPKGMNLVMQRLPNLTHLSLEGCRESVTDATLAHIFRNETKLQHLALDDCMRITDEGLLGYGPDPAPIHNLKGLQSLSLRGCRNISNRALSKALKFVELRKLVLGYCHKISSMGIEELVENCPALEDLTISSCLMIDDDAMFHIAQGLPRLKRLNVSNCINLTSKSIDYVVEHCKSLKELSMCGIDSLEIQEVQEKFLQMKPKILELNL